MVYVSNILGNLTNRVFLAPYIRILPFKTRVKSSIYFLSDNERIYFKIAFFYVKEYWMS